ncbi:MAG: hypothetical protein O7C65_00150 [Planctomycetota bacterium]|nr:hypothetical protein [Planctomycetota bacterium]
MANQATSDSEIDSALELFVEKAEKLHNSGFRARIKKTGGIRTKLSYNIEIGFSESLEGPSAEEVDAFVLTFRFFIQDNEPISLRNMADLLTSLSLDIPAVANFHKSRANLNTFLGARIWAVVDGEQPTHREVLWTMIYGDLSHRSPAYAAKVKAWKSNPLINTFVRMEFLTALMYCQSAIDVLARNVQTVIEHRQASAQKG